MRGEVSEKALRDTGETKLAHKELLVKAQQNYTSKTDELTKKEGKAETYCRYTREARVIEHR